MQTSNKLSLPNPWFMTLVMDQFPTQVIAAKTLLLKGKAFAVIEQNAESHKTFLLAISPEARSDGLHIGMPVTIAKHI